MLEIGAPAIGLISSAVQVGQQITKLQAPSVAGMTSFGIKQNINGWNLGLSIAALFGGHHTTNSLFRYSGPWSADIALGTLTHNAIWDVNQGLTVGLQSTTNAFFSEDTGTRFEVNHTGNTVFHHVEGGTKYILSDYNVHAKTMEELDGLNIHSLEHVGLVATGRHDWNPNTRITTRDFTVGGIFYIDGQEQAVMNDLFGQQGVFAGVTAPGHVTGTSTGEDWKIDKKDTPECASKSFSGTADSIEVADYSECVVEEDLELTATKGDVLLGAGSTTGGKNSTSIAAEGDIIGNHYIKEDSKGKQKKYDRARIIGGKGKGKLHYVGGGKWRRVGVRLNANGKIRGKVGGNGALFNIQSGADIVANGRKGVNFKGYFHKYHKKGKQHTSQCPTNLTSTDGKIFIASSEGVVELQGAHLSSKTPGTVFGQQGINLSSQTQRTTNRKLFGIIKDVKDEEMPTRCDVEDKGQYLFFSPDGDIRAEGFVYKGDNSTLVMNAKDIFLGARVLKRKGRGLKRRLSTDKDAAVKAAAMAALGKMSPEDLKALLLKHGYKAVNPQNINNMLRIVRV